MKYKKMLGETIYKLRKEKGLSQAELGALVGVSNKAVSKWETDEANPDIQSLPLVAEALGVTLDELLSDIKHDKKDFEPKKKRVLGMSGTVVNTTDEYEFVSDKKNVKGKPFLHIHFGKNFSTIGAKANGTIAIGNVATGNIAIGFISRGLISFGLISIGLLAFGLISLGLLAFGSITFAGISIGAIAAGVVSVGGVAIGAFAAIGGVAIGGYVAVGGLAIGFYAITGESGKAIGEHIIIINSIINSLQSSFSPFSFI